MKKTVIYIFWYLLSLLPLRILYFLSDILKPIVYYLVRYRRKVVHKNLLLAFPEKTNGERKKIEKRYYSFFCDYIVETVKLISISKEQLMRRMTFSGVDKMIKDMDDNDKNFCFVYLGHYGNWEWIASLPMWSTNEKVRFGQIYHPLRNKAMDQLFLQVRGRFHGESIPMKTTLRRIIELKRERQKMIIGFISDQLPKWNSIHHFSPFFGQETAVFTGTEQIGKQIDAIIYYGEVTHPKRGYYHCEFKRITITPQSMPDFQITDIYMKHLEKMIQETPDIWLWSHDRWKRTKEEWVQRQKEETK